MVSSRSSSFFALLTLALPAVVRGAAVQKRADSCACGYVDSNGRVWREAIESDFSAPGGALGAVESDWQVQTWTAPASGAALARQNVQENVFPFQDALGLRTNAYDGSGTTKISEIDTKRTDILYGTFRTRAQIPSVPGVCFGFFTYNGETTPVSEIDIEFLTSDEDYYQRVHYTNQPGNIDGEADPEAYHVPGADFTTFGEHRFDWIPGQTQFYYNGEFKDSLQKNVPSIPSALIANVWSNGDPGWTKGPPTADATATVHYIKAYFNSTSFDEGAFGAQCAAAGGVPACAI